VDENTTDGGNERWKPRAERWSVVFGHPRVTGGMLLAAEGMDAGHWADA